MMLLPPALSVITNAAPVALPGQTRIQAVSTDASRSWLRSELPKRSLPTQPSMATLFPIIAAA